MSNTFTWNTTNGVWSVGSNWTDITSATPGPPTSTDVADFFANGGTISGTGTALQANFAGNNLWTLAGNFSVGTGVVAPGSGTAGDVEVQSGTWALSHGIFVGQGGTGTVIVGNGATISTGGTFNAVGYLAGSDGNLTIDAGGAFVSTLAPQTNIYGLVIGAAGSSGSFAAATGSVLVTGTGALLDTNGHSLQVGLQGNGTLTVSHGGSVIAGTPNSRILNAVEVGNHGTTGSVIVTDPGSQFTANGFFGVGREGDGSLLVENQGRVVIGVDGTGNNGELGIGGTGSAVVSGSTIFYVGGHGSGTVTSGGDLFSQLDVNIGSNGVDGDLDINNAGTVEAGNRILIGNSRTVASGTTIISHSGTTITTGTTVLTSNGVVNVGPGGVLKADGSGITSPGTAAITVSAGAGSTGTLNVTGIGALVDSNGYRISIGSQGTGSMTVSQGGTAEAGSPFAGDPAAVLGFNANGTGSLTVTDPGSSFIAAGDLIVGNAGTGTLFVLNAATVTADQVDIGSASGAIGSVDVAGNNALLSITGALNIGISGTADLTIGTGGTVSAATPSIGGIGTITLAGGTLDPIATLTNAGIISGFGALDDALVNNSNVIAESGELEVTGPISGSGNLTIDPVGTLDVSGSIAAGQSVTFAGADATLILGTPGNQFTDPILSLQDDDRIELAGLSISGAFFTQSSTPDVGTITVTGSETYIFNDVTFAAGANTNFTVGNDPTTGNDFLQVACYLAGTLILTDRGEVPMESLTIGDRVITRSGEAKPIKWLGRRSYAGAFAAANPDLAPILIRAGALAEGTPRRDLYVSPEHAMYIDRVLIPARHLVNGSSILAMRDIDPIRYFHIELQEHDVIYAEGAAAETFIDCDSRGIFHNAAEFAALYPNAEPSAWRFCAKVVERGRKLAAINARLAARAARLGLSSPAGPLEGHIDHADHAGISGWAWCRATPLAPVRLEILVDGTVAATVLADRRREDLRAAGIADGRHGFELAFARPLDPFARHTIGVRRAADRRPLMPPLVIEPAGRLDAPARAALATLLRQATQQVQTATDAETLLNLLAGEAEQARHARLRLLRRESPTARRRGASDAPARRALVIDAAWPRPDRDAGSQAIVSHMQSLLRLRWHVSFTATAPLGEDADAKARLEALGITCHALPGGSVEALLRETAERYQLVYLHRLAVASAYAGLARQYQSRARLIYSLADLHHLRLARQAAVEARPELERHAVFVRRQELLAAHQADAVITHSPAEAKLLARDAPGLPVAVVPWAVPANASALLPWEEREGVVLVANFRHEPNADGLLWLFREVMPLVWAEAPVVLSVAGAELPGAIARTLSHPLLRLFGYVRDLRPLLAGSRLAVAPLRYGAGIKGKVVEAWATGLPCAMTPVAAEGLPLDATLRATVAADAAGLARLILDLHADAARNAAAARAAQAALRRAFSQRAVDAALAAVVSPAKPAQPVRRPTAAPERAALHVG